jgi:hypothetical protein
MTLIEFTIFSKVRKTELMHNAWTKSPPVDSPNVRALINRFNKVLHTLSRQFHCPPLPQIQELELRIRKLLH